MRRATRYHGLKLSEISRDRIRETMVSNGGAHFHICLSLNYYAVMIMKAALEGLVALSTKLCVNINEIRPVPYIAQSLLLFLTVASVSHDAY